ncbi:MAG: heme-binding domain-containing protein [Flavobacteriaceae bacterium]
MKIVKKIATALMVAFVLMQFYRPEKNIAQGNHMAIFVTETNPSEAVKSTLAQSCFDCHSNNTVYPWYENIAPVSYWLADHIAKGKSELNFSDWDGYDTEKKVHKLQEIKEMVEEEKMPLKPYTLIHKLARLSPEERSAIISWTERTSALYQLDRRPE